MSEVFDVVALRRRVGAGMGVVDLEGFGLSVRVINLLEQGGIVTLEDLLSHTQEQLLTKRQIGPGSVRAILDALSKLR
jgi:DNA-directed RNA polymerase alpha subunit